MILELSREHEINDDDNDDGKGRNDEVEISSNAMQVVKATERKQQKICSSKKKKIERKRKEKDATERKAPRKLKKWWIFNLLRTVRDAHRKNGQFDRFIIRN